ncbi:MAG: ABC transporter permease subunit [Clostridiales bacterium]|jgi:NitT/TauT family transport system permease protein|nr:ABC transporter permease subunit [Clostridiales bacterium]
MKYKNLSALRFVLSVALTIAGFVSAIIVNAAVPQAAAVKINRYEYFGGTLDFNILYRYAAAGIIILYLGLAVFAYFSEERRVNYVKRAPFRFALGVALALWDILGTKYLLLPQPFFPGPAAILETFLNEPAFVLENTLYSLKLYAAGFTAGVTFGVGTGILIGWFPRVYYWVSPVLKITGVIPAVAWMPFALTLAPTPFTAAVFLMTMCAWFPIASFTAQGVQSTAKVHFEVAKTLGANTAQLVFRVAIPHALPQIFGGISMANGFMFTTLVMSEMMGQPGGLGYYIQLSRVWSAYYKVFAAIIIMAALFSIILYIIGIVQNRALRWQKGLVK